ncbi:MAG: hypothetical protein KDD09_24345, partial [Phaeodactylibacter sp.]|nr:hypothetical protein [Phaeodactylibacter sp.]
HIDTLAYGVLNAPLLQISGWPAPPNGQETLTICFFDQPDCCTTLTFSVPCDTDCDFTATVTLLPCEANGLLRFSLTTSSNDPNLPWVMANINGQYFGRFAMNTTVEIGQIINDGSFGVLDVVVEAWAGPSSGPICSVTVPVDVSGCVSNCEIPGLEAEPLGCTQFGAYEVLLSFATDSLVGRNLDIYVNGDQIATNAAPVDWPVEVFPYNPGQSQDVITICYTDDPDCCESIAVDPLPCNCPGFGDVTIAPNNCRDDGTFTATLNIGTPAPAVGTVFIVESANYIAEFTFADLPVEIGPFPGTGAPQTVHVYIPGTDCQETATFITPNCGNGGCIFTSVIAEPYSCDGGQFLIDVAVQVNNPGTSGYFIFADGQINGPYSYNEPFVTLGPFDGDAVTVYDLLILDIEDPSCFGYAEVGPIDCGMVCDITNLLVQPLGCNDDGTYNIFLNFEVDNPGNDFFEVYGRNGNLIGYYSLDERPIVIEGLSPSASGEGYLRVCINDRPNCCEVIEFPEPDCVDVCRISDVQAEFAYCDDAGNFYVRLSFNFDNVSSGGFRVFGNGQDYGTYSYTMPFPVVVGPIAPTGALVYELIVADLNHPDCRGFTTFGAFDCNNDPQVCITFDEFETAVNDTINLAFGNPRDSIYDEEGVIFNAVAVPLGNNTNFFDWVVGSANAPCGLVGSGGNLYVNGGVEMDFSQFPSVPTTVTFDFTFCNNSTVIPQIVIGVNGELYSGPINDLPGDLPGGITIEFIPLANSLSQGQIILHGPIEQLLIGGQRIFIDNLCFNQPPPQLDDCISFDVYDGFPTDTLADFGQPQDMLYEEDGVIVTARRIEWNGGANFFTGVYDFDESGCGVMDDDDAALHFGGALRFNFTGLLNLPESVSFDLAFCPGQEQNILLLINGESYRGAISALPDMLSNVAITAMISTPNGHIWRVELTGTVEAFEIGGSGLAIDDVCFNTAPQEEEVWPGDANADNIAHHIDLLNIGLAYGFQGTPRLVDGANWTGVAAASWPQEFANGVNYKHADCNGDGVVDANDRQVLAQNYGLTHGPLGAVPSLPGTDIDPPAYIDFPGLIPVGTSFNIPIIVGSQNLPIQDVYGIAFTVVFDPQVFDPGALEIAYPVSWFGEPGINTLSIDRTYAAEGRIEVALTRTDQNNVSGYGPVAYLIGIIDDIAGFRPDTEVSIENVVAISVDEVLIPVQGRTVKFELQYKEEEPPAEAKGV